MELTLAKAEIEANRVGKRTLEIVPPPSSPSSSENRQIASRSPKLAIQVATDLATEVEQTRTELKAEREQKPTATEATSVLQAIRIGKLTTQLSQAQGKIYDLGRTTELRVQNLCATPAQPD